MRSSSPASWSTISPSRGPRRRRDRRRVGHSTASGVNRHGDAALFNAYVAEFRQYVDYDNGLKTGPYNFGFLNTLPDWVEHFPYQDGLLISYWDSSFTDNNTSQHPGGGLILPIDAHPNALLDLIRPSGAHAFRHTTRRSASSRPTPLRCISNGNAVTHPVPAGCVGLQRHDRLLGSVDAALKRDNPEDGDIRSHQEHDNGRVRPDRGCALK